MSATAKAMTRMFSETVFELPLARNYCARWGLPEAARELVQNALDSESPFEYELNDLTGRFSVTSRHSKLDPKTLLLGTTTKDGDPDAIGAFGEGYKIAMLVLARVGYRVTVYNGDVEWRPEFRDSKKFGTEILCVVQTPARERREGLTFEIENLAEGDPELIRKTCLKMQHEIGETIEVPEGRILLKRPGELYVGSLFICRTELKFGYDVNPKLIRLERDRQTVNDFDLKWIAKDMWFHSERWDDVAAMIDQQVPDLEYGSSSTPELVKEALYRIFVAKYPGHIVVRNNDELKELAARGITKVVVMHNSAHTIISNYPAYQSRVYIKTRTPADYLQEWFDKHQYHIHHDAKRDMTALLEQATKWRSA